MTRDAEHTPSPQSVVVPREPTIPMLNAGWSAVRPQGIDPEELELDVVWSAMLAAAPAPSSLAGGEVRDMSGETVMGMRVAAYRHPASCPPDLDKSEWLAFFNGSPPNTYCEHWSTPGEHRTDVERLFTETDVRRILNALTPRHEAPASPAWRDEYNRVEAIREAAEGQDRIARSTADPIAKSDAETQAAGHWTRYEREVAKLNAASGHEAPASPSERELDLLDAVMRAGGIVKTAAALPDKAAHLSLLTDALNRADAILTEGLNGAPVRHEAPAEGMRAALVEIANRPLLDEPVSADGHRNRCPSCGHAWNIHKTPHHAPTCDRMTAIAALNEAPAEGAGEHDPIRSVRTIMARAVERKDQETLDHARIALDALRARSSAPEAREGEAWDIYPSEVTTGTTTAEMTAAPSADKLRIAVVDIAAERQRQVDVEGWTEGHDDEHDDYEMARAASCYAMNAGRHADEIRGVVDAAIHHSWPWDRLWWKPKDRRSDLVRAGALIVAEIERLDRQALAAMKAEGA